MRDDPAVEQSKVDDHVSQMAESNRRVAEAEARDRANATPRETGEGKKALGKAHRPKATG